MGTRAAFWAGDPRNLKARRWLGCIAWDGYPEGLPELADVTTEEAFLAAVESYKEKRDDFADPAKGGWPFPWADDIFLTDYTYAWIEGRLVVASYHTGFVQWEEATAEDFEWPGKDCLPSNVPAASGWDRGQPDSIMLISTA